MANSGFKGHVCFCTFKIKIESQNLDYGSIHLDFKGAKTCMSFESSFWTLEDAGGSWLGSWHIDLDLDLVTGLWYNHAPNLGSLSRFWRFKEHPYTLSPDFGLLRVLKVPHWSFSSWSRFGYGHWFWDLEDARGSWLGFGILTLIWIWSMDFSTSMFVISPLSLDFEVAKNIHIL